VVTVTGNLPVKGIYLFEHRRRPHQREIALHVLGE